MLISMVNVVIWSERKSGIIGGVDLQKCADENLFVGIFYWILT